MTRQPITTRPRRKMLTYVPPVWYEGRCRYCGRSYQWRGEDLKHCGAFTCAQKHHSRLAVFYRLWYRLRRRMGW